MARTVISPPDEPPTADGLKAGGWWHDSSDGRRLVCDLCPRSCALGPGDRGFCFVRQNVDGRIVSTTYGRSTGFCIDPIEKKPLNHFYPGTAVLSFGTAGCNLGCKFCQNWSISKSREIERLSERADPEAIAEAARQTDCRSVAFTYNDPIIWAEYAIDTARACRAAGVKTVAVTSGYIRPEARKAFYEVMDAANVDLKGFTEEFYFRLTSGHLEPVCDTLRWLVHESDVWVEITNLVIPQANDSTEELTRMCDWLLQTLGPDVPVHFTAFHPDFKLRDREPTPPETLARAHDIARRAGLRYAYTGNLSDPRRQSTYCPGCCRVVIERDGYYLGQYALAGGACRHCGAKIAGHFDDAPGDWGGRRVPVRIADFARPVSSKGATRMDTDRDQPAQPPRIAPEVPQLSPEQEQRLVLAAGRRVAAAVLSSPPEKMEDVLGDAANVPVLGAFVSLKRGGQLRSCCGYLGRTMPLCQAVDQAAVRAAKEDPRFPPIAPSELEHLDMEVWVLWGMQEVKARGRDRVGAVTIGRHGLQIARGNARGLLLPGVAVEHHLDAEGFLGQVCRKAGLPIDAWLDDDTALATFEGYALKGRVEPAALPQSVTVAPGGPAPGELAALADFCRQNLVALMWGATPSFYLTGGYDGQVAGLILSIHTPQAGEPLLETSRMVLRDELPLQSTLFELVRSAAAAMQSSRIDPRLVPSMTAGVTVLWDPAMHGAVAQPALEGVDPRYRAVVAVFQSKWAMAFDPAQTPAELLADAVRQLRIQDAGPALVYSLAVATTQPKVAASNVSQPQAGATVRPPAVAGRFYPASPEEINRALDQMLPEKRQPEPWAAAMVPHAGWVFSGRLAAAVLSRVEIPQRVIIFCPKHSRTGADWAVAPHQTWSIPGGSVESDPELARQLAQAIPGLELDAAAHAVEHAIEVQLPILARLAPQARVVGIAMHGGDWEALGQFADRLAEVLRGLPDRPLLVISTDMNHYADDQRTRRLDRMALDALETLDPARLYQTVTENRISMCGVLPTVVVMETLRRLEALHRFESVGYATSAEASGDTQRVVGYAGMLLG